MNATRRLTRSRTNRLLGGVEEGMAEYLGIDPSLARVLYVLISICSVAFPGIVVYVICWMVVPEE